MQALGITITREEFDSFWKTIYTEQKTLGNDGRGDKSKGSQPQVVTYLELINAFT